jgi:hypothetical protein
MDDICSPGIPLNQGINILNIRTISQSPLTQVLRDLGLQAMLGPKEKIVYNTAKLNRIPDLSDLTLPYTDHFLLIC